MSTNFHILDLPTESDYLEYFIENYCRQEIFTKDGIRIRFRKSHFYHAFFETTISHKDCFSIERAQHMPEIKKILQSKNSRCHCGWDSKKHRIDPHKRVSYILGPFVVIVLLHRNKDTGVISGEFITCFEAEDITFNRIKADPIWDASMV
jgi:hypothetical protein